MRKFLVLLAALFLQATTAALMAATFPEISQGDQVKWYFIQFTQSGAVVADQGNAQEVLTESMAQKDAQIWKVEGNASSGYTFTNKLGRKLYVTSTAQNTGFFRASSAPTSNYTFTIVENAAKTGFLIAPKGNTNVYMNQWQGAGVGKRLGLWGDKADTGSMVDFKEASFDAADVVPLIPYPASLVKGDGTLRLQNLAAIVCADSDAAPLWQEFAARLKAVSGINLPMQTSLTSTQPVIMLTKNNSLADEAYTLRINASGIAIEAAGRAGFFYALQTLKQLLPFHIHSTAATPASVVWEVPFLTIEDQPRFGHRGFMLDSSRHFLTKEEVKCAIDIMAFYKLNRFHWHLTDDQGWRIEIPEYPLLTEVGAIRAGSLTSAGLSQKFFDDTEYGRGCYYTLDDLREIVAYAAERCITIMPEVDLPGHMVAALASYPEFSCNPSRTYDVRQDSGISHDVLDVSNPEVIKFLKVVLGHVAEVFPGKYIHIGGDECPTENWTASASCQTFASEKGITINELQGWLVEELGEYLRDNYGKDIMVWDELLGRWPASNSIKPVIMAWNSIGLSATAAAKGFKSVIVPYSNLYFDFMQVTEAEADVNEGYQGGWGPGHVNSLSSVYNLNPVSSLAGKEEYALGTQGNLWAETLCNFQQVQYQMLPRLLALSEIAWLDNSKKNWLNFLARLQSHDEIFEAEGWNYAKHHFQEPERTAAESALLEARELLQKTQPGMAGFATEAAYNALRTACEALEASPENASLTTALQNQISTFKNSAIVQPDPNKTYQIVSASTYYKAMYAGSTVYASGDAVRFHYTPQLEPEELWKFESTATAGSYVLRNVLTGKALYMPSYNANVQLNATNSTPVRVDKATVANGKYTYVPGAVNLSKTQGYSTSTTAQVNRMFADVTGNVKSYNDPKLCCQGTWTLREVTDYQALLEGLVRKAELIVLKQDDALSGKPSPAALEYLQQNLITPAREVKNCDADTYNIYMEVYKEYLGMPRSSFLDLMSEGIYYQIHNAYPGWASYYAAVNTSGAVVPTNTNIDAEACLWRLKKNADGTVYLYNKSNDKGAYVSSATQDTNVTTSATPTAWKLSEFSSDESSGILIQAGEYSWYTNPNVWQTILLKPCAWGASVWTFVPTKIVTGVAPVMAMQSPAQEWFDLQGRRVSQPVHGVYVSRAGQKVIH